MVAKYKYFVDLKALELLWDCVETVYVANESSLVIKQIRISGEFPKDKRLELDMYGSSNTSYWANDESVFIVSLRDFSTHIKHLQRLQRIIDNFEEQSIAVRTTDSE